MYMSCGCQTDGHHRPGQCAVPNARLGRRAGQDRPAGPPGKTPGQVSLRFLVQEGAIVIPRTSKRERLEENISIFDFELDPAQMDEIRGLALKGTRVVDWSGAPNWD